MLKTLRKMHRTPRFPRPRTMWPEAPECAGCGRADDDCLLVATARGEVQLCPKCRTRTRHCSLCGQNVPPGFDCSGKVGGPPVCEDCEPIENGVLDDLMLATVIEEGLVSCDVS